jgi:tRNA(Ile)-lysidine synthase
MNEEPRHPPLVAQVADVIARQALIESGDRVLVAVSGGADSMALLHILHALAGEIGFGIEVGHFDHRLRDTSSVDRRMVEVTTTKLGYPFHCGEGDVHARADTHDETVEEAARKLRYQFLSRVSDEIDARRLATGHTRDDQIETVLMRILRGTGIRGLAGVPLKRGRLIRPLLGVPHRRLVDYCREHHIPFIEDPTNRDRRFTRNWIRYELLPSVRTYYPNVGENLLRLSRNAADALEKTRRANLPILGVALRREAEGAWVLDLRDVFDLDADARYILFGDILVEHLGFDPDFTRVHYEKLARLSGRAATSGEQLSLPGLAVRREFDTLVFLPAAGSGGPQAEPAGVGQLDIPGRLSYGDVRIQTVVLPASEFEKREYNSIEPALFESGGNRGPGVAYFALENITPPLAVRRPQPGDRMRPFGMLGSKKLSDVLIDKKIPLRRRDSLLVIADRKEILWLVGVVTSESTRIVDDTREVLKITVTPE